jgi:hypothetical protein
MCIRDRIKGRAGNDRICAGAGADKLFGGSGRDFLLGQGGADDLFGGAGNRDFCYRGVRDEIARSCERSKGAAGPLPGAQVEPARPHRSSIAHRRP